MKKIITLLKEQLAEAFTPSIKATLWLLKMMIPIMLLVSLLDFYGIIGFISQYTTPLFNIIGLDGKAAFVFITSCLTNIYSAIGVMSLFDFSFREVTIMASMCLIAHNLIIEGAIQSRTGVTFWGVTLLRIISSLLCGYLLNIVIPGDISGNLYLEMTSTKATSLAELLNTWAVSSLKLAIKVTIIIYSLNVLHNLLKVCNMIDILTKALKPIITILGLPRSTSLLWVVANTIGLAYGGAIIVEEIAKGEITEKEASLLNISISQTHSLLEDTILFIVIGVGAWWLILPRLTLSIISVWSYKGVKLLSRVI